MNDTAQLRPDGFRERGGEMTRMEAFVDAAFAFAVTMLVISVGTIPDTPAKLIEALKGTPAFAASFAQIAAFWYEHMTWSRRYGLDDRRSIVLSLLLVLLVMVFIYPLKAVASTFFGWITGGWLPYGFDVHTIADLRLMFVVYGLMFGSMSIVVSMLYVQAWQRREALGLSEHERIATYQRILLGFASAMVATLSIAAAFCLPEHPPGAWVFGMPGMVYALMVFSDRVPAWYVKRARARLLAPGPA
jgi:uncharacterized membrane protein